MADTYGYESSEWRGRIRYSCLDCNFDILDNEASIVEHCRRNSHGLDNNRERSDYAFITKEYKPRQDVIITLGYLCWNTRDISTEGALALVEEASRLKQLGFSAFPIILDNGSIDGTYHSIRSRVGDLAVVERNTRNFGISIARNQIIDISQEYQADYLLMLDGDIEVVPFSTYAMWKYLSAHKVGGCIGANSLNYTSSRLKSATHLYEIDPKRIKDDVRIAWTQYGLFSGRMLQRVRFDEHGPLGGPGWGFEDDDLYYQMTSKGWSSEYFTGMCYLHRNVRSSIPNLRASGINVEKTFADRKLYVLNKWASRGFDMGSLAAAQLPVVEAHA